MAGSFWGLSTEGKEARGFPRQLGFTSQQQMADWLARQNQFGTRGNYFGDQVQSYWNARAATPQPGIADVRGTGQQIFDYQPALDRRGGRFNDMLARYGSGVTGADVAGGRQRGYLDEAAGNISRTGDTIGDQINATARDLTAASEAGYGDIISGLRGQSGRLRDDVGRIYGDVQNTLGQGYGSAISEIEKTRPGGELQAATAARAFAPQRANVMRRLIASGIDPNSPEGVAAASNVGEQQARAMDDKLGGALERYGTQMANLQLGRGEALSGAQERGLGMSADIEQNLMRMLPGLQQGGLNQRLGIESARSGDIISNLQDTRGLSNQLLGQRGQQEQLQRAMQMQDWDAVNSIMNQQNQDELLGLNLGNQQFGMGGDFLDWKQGREDQPYNQLANLSQQDIQNMFRSGQQARSFGQDASQAFNQNYLQEAQNAGWGTNMLAGLGGAALNAFLPGAGSVITGAAGGGGGGGGGLDLSSIFNLFKRRDNTGMPRGYIYGGG